jgi:hypothetical protein
MAAAVVNGDRVPDEGRENRRGAGPGLEDLFIAGFVHIVDPLQKLGSGKGALFNTSAHIIY